MSNVILTLSDTFLYSNKDIEGDNQKRQKKP